MDKYLWDHVQYNKLYNCSYMNSTEWAKSATPAPRIGVICTLLGLTTYGICLKVITRKTYFQHSSFKIMFFLGLLDCLCLLGNSFVTGYLHIVGSVFCTHPNLQYITGCILVGCWFGETFGCALLALDRCLVFASPRLSKLLFEQKRIYLWIAAMFIYALSFAVFLNPVILNTAAIMWTYDPFIIFPPDVVPIDHNNYVLKMNDYSNHVLIGGTAIFYFILIMAINFKSKGTNQNKIQFQLITIAGIICSLISVPALTFFLLEYIPPTDLMLYVCYFSWQCGAGCGGLIMLIFNKSIRMDAFTTMRKTSIVNVSVKTTVK